METTAVPSTSPPPIASDTFQRTVVNPWQWSVDVGFNQGKIVTGESRTLYLAGQASMSAEGQPQHPGDMAAQLAPATDNLEAVLRQAGTSLASVVRLNIYTTDIDAFSEHYKVLAGRLPAASVTPPATLLGVTRLAFPELMVELEATAVA